MKRSSTKVKIRLEPKQIIYRVTLLDVHPNALCGVRAAVCMCSVSDSRHSSQMYKPPPPPTAMQLSPDGGDGWEIEACFAPAFLNILLCSLFATPSFKSQSLRLLKTQKPAWWSISPHREDGRTHPLFVFLCLSTIVLTYLFSSLPVFFL